MKAPTTNSRRYKVEWMKEKINFFFDKKPKGAISKKKLLAEFALSNDSTRRTGREILELLNDAGFIKINEDLITK